MRIGSLFIAGLIGFSLLGCSERDAEIPEVVIRPEFSFQMEETETKNVVKSFTIGDRIGLLLTDASNNPYDGETDCFNASYKLLSDGKWDPSRDLRLSEAVGRVYAYYPYDESLTAEGNLTLKNGEELLATRTVNTVSSGSPKAIIQLSHVMALLRFNISSALGTVSRVRLRNLPLSGSWNLFDGSLSVGSETTIMDIEDLSLLSSGIPVIPGRTLEVMVYTDQGCFVSKPGEQLVAGKSYTITLN